MFPQKSVTQFESVCSGFVWEEIMCFEENGAHAHAETNLSLSRRLKRADFMINL